MRIWISVSVLLSLLLIAGSSAHANQQGDADRVREANDAARYYIGQGDYEVAARHNALSLRALRRVEGSADGDALVIDTNLIAAEIEFRHLGNAHRMERYAREAFSRLDEDGVLDVRFAEAAFYSAFGHLRGGDAVEAAMWFRLARNGFAMTGDDSRAELFSWIADGYGTLMVRQYLNNDPTVVERRLIEFRHPWTFLRSDIPHFQDGEPSIYESALPLNRMPPVYPGEAMQNNRQGFVIIGFDVDPAGRTHNATVLYATPEGVFERAALSSIREWEYNPMLDANDVPQWDRGLRTVIDFTLR